MIVLAGWLAFLSLMVALAFPTNAWSTDDGYEAVDFDAMPQLTGDWFGLRSNLADSGTTVQADNTSFFFGNTTGGIKRAFVYGGHGDYVFLTDFGKLGVHKGLHLKLRAEHRFGETIVDDVGCFISPTLIADLPVFGSEQLYLTNVLFTQELNDRLAVFAGKMDTLDGDKNAFAHARGKTQFSNMAFVFNPIVGATVPYSTLGVGFVVLYEHEPLLTFTLLNSTDTTNTSGFEQLFNDGVLLSVALRLPTRFFDMPGHQFFGGTWNNQTYTSIREAYIPYPDVAIPTTRGSWSLFWNFDQYLVVDSNDSTRGWGTFGRAGIADVDTSPLAWFLSFGIGGNVPIDSRPADTFGIGWYYAGLSNEIGTLITNQFGPVGNGQGVECYYNYEWAPAIRVTPDLQFLVPSLSSFDPSVLVGLRAQLIF